VAEVIFIYLLKAFPMSFDFSEWIDAYGKVAPDESIEYRDESGTWREETDYRLRSISSEFQRRGYISREELRKIGKWKAGGRIDHHLRKNSTSTVEEQSELAFRASGDEESIEELTELKGVSVPVASTILTMFDPSSFAVVDFRAFRALGVANPALLDSVNYSRYVDFMNHFLNYGTNSAAYSFYMDEVRNLARQEGLLPRQIDMALWAYDKSVI
jgi:hypothetical protein